MSGRKENKIEKAGVHVTCSGFVDAPVIDEYPLTLECKVIEMQEALGEMHVVGEVVNMQPTSRYWMHRAKWIWASCARSPTIPHRIPIAYSAIQSARRSRTEMSCCDDTQENMRQMNLPRWGRLRDINLAHI